MSPQTNRNILIGMAAGVLLGAIAGAVIPDAMLLFGVVGRLFVNALQILLLPLIPAVIIAGIAGLGHASKLGRAAVSTVLYFVATTAVAVVIGTVLVLVLNPGETAASAGAFIPDMVARARATSFTDIFAAFVPENLINSLGAGQYLGLVVLSLVFGAVICAMGAKAKIVVDFFKVIADITLHIATYVMYAAPVGLFLLVGSAVARNPEAISSVGGNLLWLTITFVAAILIHGLVVLPLMLRFLGHRSPIEYAGKTAPALMTAFGTASSAAALPVTFRNVVDDSDVDARAGSLVLPLGVSMNANGTAIYLVIAAIFTAQMFGVPLSIFQVVAIALLSVLLSLGTAGAPGMALFSLTILFGTLQFPIEAYGVIGLLVVVDWLFDRGRAVLNAWGDIVGAAIIGESFEFKTARVTRTITSDSSTYRRERPSDRPDRPERRDRRPVESDRGRTHRDGPPRERTPRGRGRTADRPPRPERPAAERPVRPPQEARPVEPRREPEPRRETPAPIRAEAPTRPPSRRQESSRSGRDSDRGERPDRPERRDRRGRYERSDRPERPEPRTQQPPVTSTEEPVAEERVRIVPPPIPRPESESRPAPQPEAQPEPARPTPEPERAAMPEIRRRPLPAERGAESTPEPTGESRPEVEFAAPRESVPEPPSEPREPRERPREQYRPQRPERDERETPEPTERAAEPAEREQPERREEPSLRDIMTNLSAARESRQEAEESAQRENAAENRPPAPETHEADRPTSFGRSKSRHGARPGGQPSGAGEGEPASQPESEPPAGRKEDFPADSVTTFGRSRRRRGH